MIHNETITKPIGITPIYTFEVSTTKDRGDNDVTLLTAQQYPWCVLQIVPIPEGKFDESLEVLKKHGAVALANGRKDFAVTHVGSGDTDGKHPERHIEVTPANYQQVLADLKECMRQAAVWWANRGK